MSAIVRISYSRQPLRTTESLERVTGKLIHGTCPERLKYIYRAACESCPHFFEAWIRRWTNSSKRTGGLMDRSEHDESHTLPAF